MNYYPPAYPSSHPILTMVGAALQSVLPPEYANPSFNTRSERESSPEPSLLFVLFSLLRWPTALRQDDAPYARLLGGLFVGLRVQSTVGSLKLRRPSEALTVTLYALGQVWVLPAGLRKRTS
jgi:hypothetical protein